MPWLIMSRQGWWTSFGGLKDIEKPDDPVCRRNAGERFDEDSLRILRAVTIQRSAGL